MNLAQQMLDFTDPMIGGWLFPIEGRVLFAMAQAIPSDGNGLVLELGSYMGKSTRYLAAGCLLSNSKLHAVDPWDSFKDKQGAELPLFMNITGGNNEPLVKYNVQTILGMDREKILKTHKATSKGALKEVKGPFDLIFIDGNHYECQQDWNAWTLRLKSHGLVVLDDVFATQYGINSPGNTLRRAVDTGWIQFFSHGKMAALTRNPEWWKTRLEAIQDESNISLQSGDANNGSK